MRGNGREWEGREGRVRRLLLMDGDGKGRKRGNEGMDRRGEG